jgi:hypothetical protein
MIKRIPFSLPAAALSVVLAAARPSPQSSSGEEQLRAQYRVSSVGGNGVVLREGTVVSVLLDGIKANPPSGNVCWPNSYKKGGRIRQPAMVVMSGAAAVVDQVRFLQVKETAYITGIEVKPSDVRFEIQTIPADANESPYRATVTFQFEKNSVASMGLQQFQDTIGDVFAIAAAPPSVGTEEPRRKRTGPGGVAPPTLQPTTRAADMQLPAIYANAQTPTDELQLNADHTLSLHEDGQVYQGTFTVDGSTLAIHVNDTATSATFDANGLVDASGQKWTRREPSASGDAVLRNADVLKMVQAGFDESSILAKIGGSKCQFDTSTDALIQLKQSGASPAVLKAILSR